MKWVWVGYDVGCTMGLTLGHGAWQIDRPSNGSVWNSYSFQPVGQWMGYSFTDLGAEEVVFLWTPCYNTKHDYIKRFYWPSHIFYWSSGDFYWSRTGVPVVSRCLLLVQEDAWSDKLVLSDNKPGKTYQSASINLCRHWPVGDLWPNRITISPWAEKVVHSRPWI